MNLNGKKKSAVLLMLVGIEKAAEILKELSPEEIEKIVNYMSDINFVSNKIASQVLSDFYNNFSKNIKEDTSFISRNFVISLLKKVLGERDAILLLDKIQDQKYISESMKKLNLIDPKEIVSLIKNEHPQIIAIIMLYLDRNQAASILSYFEDKLSVDIIERIAKFSGLKKSGKVEFIRVINNLLEKCEHSMCNNQGMITIIELLKLIKQDQKNRIFKQVLALDIKLAKKIKIELFELSDITHLDDTYVQRLIKIFPLDELSEVIRTETEELKEKFYRNMSPENVNFLKSSFSEMLSISNNVVQEKRTRLLNLIKNILYNG